MGPKAPEKQSRAMKAVIALWLEVVEVSQAPSCSGRKHHSCHGWG